jgi:hypothetical protein
LSDDSLLNFVSEIFPWEFRGYYVSSIGHSRIPTYCIT